MPQKVALGVTLHNGKACQQSQHLVAAPVAVVVVERFEINASIGGLDQATQENAAMVEESAAVAASSLAQ